MFGRPSDTAQTLIAAIKARDINAIEQIYAPQFVARYNFMPEPLQRGDAIEMLRDMFAKVRALDYPRVEISSFPNGFVLECTLRVSANNGRAFESINCIVATLSEGGRIESLREYLDPSAIAALDDPAAAA